MEQQNETLMVSICTDTEVLHKKHHEQCEVRNFAHTQRLSWVECLKGDVMEMHKMHSGTKMLDEAEHNHHKEEETEAWQQSAVGNMLEESVRLKHLRECLWKSGEGMPNPDKRLVAPKGLEPEDPLNTMFLNDAVPKAHDCEGSSDSSDEDGVDADQMMKKKASGKEVEHGTFDMIKKQEDGKQVKGQSKQSVTMQKMEGKPPEAQS